MERLKKLLEFKITERNLNFNLLCETGLDNYDKKVEIITKEIKSIKHTIDLMENKFEHKLTSLETGKTYSFRNDNPIFPDIKIGGKSLKDSFEKNEISWEVIEIF